MKHIIAPSILSSDFSKLNEEIQMLNQSVAPWIHLDVMDGKFVPNFTFGMPLVAAIDKLTDKILDVHLMMIEPEKYIESFRKSGADFITVHYEACPHLHRTLQQIKETGAKAGVALNPHTPVQMIFDILEDIDLVIIMSVNPGFGGQKFIYSSLQKIKSLRKEIDERNLDTLIEIDGGVGLQNAELILNAGAHVLVAGNAVFGDKNPMGMIEKLMQVGSEKGY